MKLHKISSVVSMTNNNQATRQHNRLSVVHVCLYSVLVCPANYTCLSNQLQPTASSQESCPDTKTSYHKP